MTPIVYSILFGLQFLTVKYRFKIDYLQLEINQIGKSRLKNN
jgi:hypothetical protein